MSVAYKYNPRYSLEDYRRWEGDWELIDGVAIDMGPSPFGRHGAMAARLAARFVNALDAAAAEDLFVIQEVDWIVDDHTVVRPDLCIIEGAIPEEHLLQAPVLIVEIISPSTAAKDRNAKFELYQQLGVRFYLIADPASNHVDVYQLVGNQYQLTLPDPSHSFQLTDRCRIVPAL